MSTVTERTGWRCRHASSTSAARRRRRTSARRRRCSRTSPVSTPSTTGRRACTVIARRVHGRAVLLERSASKTRSSSAERTVLRHAAAWRGRRPIAFVRPRWRPRLNFRYRDDGTVNVALDETTSVADVRGDRRRCLRRRSAKSPAAMTPRSESPVAGYPDGLARTSPFLTHPVFNRASLRNRDDALHPQPRAQGHRPRHVDDSARLLHDEAECGLRDAADHVAGVLAPHPFVPVDQMAGYQQIFRELETALAKITGFAAVSLQPNSGAQGEFAGLMVIRALSSRPRRRVARCRADSGVRARDQSRPAPSWPACASSWSRARRTATSTSTICARRPREHRDRLAALMVTYPSTHGVFEESIQDICAIVHEHGGQVYMDGANMNAQVGLTSPAAIGADVCHLNLHKTFSIPHGGGGPGMGPIGVAAHLAPYLAGAPGRQDRGSEGDSRAVGRAVEQREHPPHLVRLHQDARWRRHDRGHAVRDPERQLHQVADSSRTIRCSTRGRTAVWRTR